MEALIFSAPSPIMSIRRCLSSPAALFVNVIARIFHGATGSTATICARRSAFSGVFSMDGNASRNCSSSGVISPDLVVKVCVSEAHHVRDAVAEHGGLSAAGAGDYQDCALYLEHRLSLHFVGPGEKAGERIAL